MKHSLRDRLDDKAHRIAGGCSSDKLGDKWSNIYHECTLLQKEAMMLYCSDVDGEPGRNLIWFKGRGKDD